MPLTGRSVGGGEPGRCEVHRVLPFVGLMPGARGAVGAHALEGLGMEGGGSGGGGVGGCGVLVGVTGHGGVR